MESSSYTFSFKRIATGAALVLGLLVVASFIVDRLISAVDSNDFIGRSISDVPEAWQPHDVIFIGDSRTNQGMSPDVFNAQLKAEGHAETVAYNMGRPGMQAPFFNLVLRKYMRETEHAPKAVFMNASFYLMYGDNWLRDVYLSYYTPDLRTAWDAYNTGALDIADAFKWYVRTHVPLMRYRKRALGLLDSATTDVVKLANELEVIRANYSRGYRTLSDDPKKPGFYHNNGFGSRGFSHIQASDVSAEGYAARKEEEPILDQFRQVFEHAREHGYTIYIYEFPWPEPICSPQFQEIVSYYQGVLKKIAAGNPNVKFIDHDYCWPIELFVDPLHLNQTGAEELSKRAAGWFTRERQRVTASTESR